MRFRRVLSCLILLAGPLTAQIDEATRRLSRDIFRELIEINTSDSSGDNTAAAHAMEKRLLAAGFAPDDVKVLTPAAFPKKGNLVARLRGTPGSKLKPILLLGHLDVVEALRGDWTTNPWELVEKDGFFYGRGTVDMKDYDAIMLTAFIRFKQQHLTPSRDVILALTSDEESGPANGVAWLVKNHRELVDAEFAINGDMGGVELEKGRPIEVSVGAAEKLYADFQLTVTNPGGHSARPPKENAIYRLAAALTRLENAPFPFELNPVTRAYFDAYLEKIAPKEAPQDAADIQAILRPSPDAAAVARLSADPVRNALLRTTCVATRLNAGHANNALPQTAQAVVNCRILPGHSAEEVRLDLVKKVADAQVAVRYIDGPTGQPQDHAPAAKPLLPAAPTPAMMKPLERLADIFWPGAPLILRMATGASDSKYTIAAGIPSFGMGEISGERNENRAHGKDERVPVASFYQAVDFFDRYLRALTGIR